jgi:hypothetical protein
MDWAVKQVVFNQAYLCLAGKTFSSSVHHVCVRVCVRARAFAQTLRKNQQRMAIRNYSQLLILSEKKHLQRTRVRTVLPLFAACVFHSHFQPFLSRFSRFLLLILSFSSSHYLPRSHLPAVLILDYADV